MWTLIIPGIVAGVITLVGNVIIYLFIKGRIDKSIDKYKIVYSGVFKEKIDVYKLLLKHIVEIKYHLFIYEHTVDGRDQIITQIKDFIHLYSCNRPFLSTQMIKNCTVIKDEFQNIFDDFFVQHSLASVPLPTERRTEITNKFFTASGKLKNDSPFSKIEELIILEMRKELLQETKRVGKEE